MIAAAMSTKKTVWFIVLSISTLTLGIVDFSCERPLKGSDVTCTCITPNNIEWKINDVLLSSCATAGICSPKPTGYEFTTDTSNSDKEYSLTVQGYDYTGCAVYSCKDLNTAEEENNTLSIAAFDSTSPSVFVEPGNNQDGNIEITTECLFKESDITVEWFYIKKNSVIEVPFTPGASFQTATACTDSCNGEAAVRLNIGFTHTESGAQTVNFGLRVYHKENTSNVLEIQTSSEYNITATSSTPTPTNTPATASTQSSTSLSSASTTNISTVVTTSSSNESTVIIVSSVLGGLFLIGIVITIVLMLLSKRRGHHPARNHRRRDQDGRHKRRDNHRYPSWQDHGRYNNAYYMEYTGMGTKMNPLYIQNRSAHRAEQNFYHGHTDHQSYTPNHQIHYGGHYNNVRLQTDMHSSKQRYYGGRGGNNISSTLHRDENNYVAPDYELYW